MRILSQQWENYFNSDQMEDFVNELIINYDLDSEFPEDED